MYHSDAGARPEVMRPALAAGDGRRVPATVLLLGTVSLLTDISSEMVASVLPLYLFAVLRLSPLEVGWIDGLFNGAAAVVRVAFAHWADRTRHHKRFALLGYGLSALARAGMFVAGLGGWMSVAVILLLDRVGKGIRTAPRDALIAASAPPQRLGVCFGVHRAMDAVGAFVGPMLATGVLLWLPGRFDAIFAVSLVFACAGWVVLARGVRAPRSAGGSAVSPDGEGEAAANTGAGPHPEAAAGRRALFRPLHVMLCAACALLALFTVSDTLVYAGLQRGGLVPAAGLPMLFVATAAVFMATAIPIGRLADRVGAIRVFVGGHVLLALMYGLVGLDRLPGAATVGVVVVLSGLYYAATDGVVMVSVARALPESVRTTGMAIVASAIGVARMGASALFGWCWNEWSFEVALALFAGGLLSVLAAGAVVALRFRPWDARGLEARS